MFRFIKIAPIFFGSFIIITLIYGTIYATVQQSYRQSANDPQIELAEDITQMLETGIEPSSVIIGTKIDIDIARSLAPYVTIFDQSGTPIVSTGLLDNQMPTLPYGVFEHAQKSGENRITWQPREGVRSATVIVPFTGKTISGFVLAGRSLREVEHRVARLTLCIFLAWAVTMVVLIVGFIWFLLEERVWAWISKKRP